MHGASTAKRGRGGPTCDVWTLSGTQGFSLSCCWRIANDSRFRRASLLRAVTAVRRTGCISATYAPAPPPPEPSSATASPAFASWGSR